MRRRPTRLSLAGLLAAATLFTAGCSSGTDDSVTTTTSAPTTATSATRASPGCGATPSVTATADPLGDQPAELDVDGQTRRYRLGVPESYDPDTPTPLVLDLHGANSSADVQSVYTQLPAKGTERGFIVVTPDAVNGSWELAGTGPDDDFLMALLDDLGARYCLDLDRIHAAGFSLGAWKAAATACTHQDRFASVALVAVEIAPDDCPLPVIAFHGTADNVVPYGVDADPGVVVTGPNAGFPGVEVNMPAWARNNGCAEETDVVHIDPDVDHLTYRDCPDDTGVELYSVVHGGHAWPGSPIDLPGITKTISATDLALDWFDSHPKAS